MAIRVVHSPGFEQLGALALAAGRSQSQGGGFSDTQRAITARDIALIRERAQVAAARERNFGRAVPSSKIESPEARNRRRQADLGHMIQEFGVIDKQKQEEEQRREQAETNQMILTKQAEIIGRDQSLTDQEKLVGLRQLGRKDKLLKRQNPSAQEVFAKSVVVDLDTGMKYTRNKNGEYKQLENGDGKKSADFGKAIKTARDNLLLLFENQNPDLTDDERIEFITQLGSNVILDEAKRIVEEQNESVALAETLQELMKTNEGRFVQISGLEGRRSAPGRGVISSIDESGKRTSSVFSGSSTQSVEFSRSVAEEEDPLSLRASALSGELGTLRRPDGGVSTEISVTVTDSRLNRGRATNIPLLVNGVPNIDDLLAGKPATSKQVDAAIKRAQARVSEGAFLPSFDNIELAEKVAENRHLEEERRVSNESDTVIDLSKMKPEEVIKQFQGLKPQERREFVNQLTEDELKVFVDHLPKIQRSAVRRAIKRLEEEQSRSRPSQVRIRDAAERLERVLFNFQEQSTSMRHPRNRFQRQGRGL